MTSPTLDLKRLAAEWLDSWEPTPTNQTCRCYATLGECGLCSGARLIRDLLAEIAALREALEHARERIASAYGGLTTHMSPGPPTSILAEIDAALSRLKQTGE